MKQLRETVQGGESAQIELKSSLSDWRKIIETIAGMATIGGGTVLVGVRPSGVPCGVQLGENTVEQFIQRVLDNTEPPIYVDVDTPQLDGATLLRIDVPPGDGPHLAFGRAFHRPGPATVRMSRDEYERRLLDRLRESSGFERRVAADCTLGDLDVEAVTRFVERAAPRGVEPGSPHDVLARLKLLSGGAPTVGAVLLFGREPQAAFPQAVVRGRVQRGASDEAGDTLAAEGTLFDQVEQVTRFVLRNLRTRAVIRDLRREERPELPVLAIREAITNAVVHRDYRSTAPTQLRLDDRALELWNPGHLPQPLTAAMLRQEHPSVPPNPLTARAFYRAGYIEEWGSGTLRIIRTLHDNGSAEPSFSEERGGIRVVLPLAGATPADLNRRQMTWLESHRPGDVFKTREYAQRFSVTQRTALSDLRDLADRGLVEIRGAGPGSHWVRL